MWTPRPRRSRGRAFLLGSGSIRLPAVKRTDQLGNARVHPFNDTQQRSRPMRVLIPEYQIRRRVDEVAAQIAGAYSGQPLTIVGVLTGCLVFLADLIR